MAVKEVPLVRADESVGMAMYSHESCQRPGTVLPVATT
jgi:hypothetical protein